MSALPDPLIGRVLRDTWRIESFVARGSMGAVYRGVNTHAGTPVAVKVLNPEFLHDEEIRERFHREATISARCDSPHLVKVFDLVADADGYVCLVMEWLHGETLAGALKRRGRLTVPEAVALVEEIGEGLHEAHLAGIVHRDLKPANIFLAEAGRAGLLVPKIVDFGISKILEAGAALTATATMMGTPHYMPVEQFDNSKGVDQRADIYALGVITYEVVAGHRPYRGLTPMAILNQVAAGAPPPLPEDVPEGVARVILRAMAKDAGDRYPTVLDYCEALLEAATAAGLAPTLATQPGTALGLAPTTGALAALPASPRWRRLLDRHRRLALGLGVGLLGLVVSLVLLVALRSTEKLGGRPPLSPLASPRGLGHLELALSGPGAAARGLAVDALGARVLGVSTRGAWTRWRLPGGKVEASDRTLSQGAPVAVPVTALALSADGRWQALGTGAGLVLLAEVSGLRRHRLELAGGASVTALAFSADGNRLLVGSARGGLEVWDVRSGRRLALLSGGGSAVTAVALDGDGGKALEGRQDGALGHWEVRERRLVLRLPVHRGAVTGVALLPPAPGLRGASASRDGVARLWELPGGTAGPLLKGHGSPVQALAVSEDGGLLLTGDDAGIARLFGPDGRLRDQERLPGPVTAVAFARGGELRLVAGPGFAARVYRERRSPVRPRGGP